MLFRPMRNRSIQILLRLHGCRHPSLYLFMNKSEGVTCLICFADRPTGTSITLTPSNTTVLRGSTVSLNCTTDANPDAHVYQLYFNDTLIGNSSSGVFNVTVDADGVYSCVPINTVGTGHNATVSITAVGKSSATAAT